MSMGSVAFVQFVDTEGIDSACDGWRLDLRNGDKTLVTFPIDKKYFSFVAVQGEVHMQLEIPDQMESIVKESGTVNTFRLYNVMITDWWAEGYVGDYYSGCEVRLKRVNLNEGEKLLIDKLDFWRKKHE